MTLIPYENLRQAQERYFARRAEAQRQRYEQEAREREGYPAVEFAYKPRSAEQWKDRAHQSFDLRIGKKRKKSRATEPVAASPAVVPTTSMSETVLAKPRRSRKKTSTAFTTGEMFPPETTEIQPLAKL